ncbi:MAG: DUF3014 domain-containing protein, partial [Rhodoferax sp.]|nr:DUF3014 domain-containing protein [Rhodoferax sp.]
MSRRTLALWAAAAVLALLAAAVWWWSQPESPAPLPAIAPAPVPVAVPEPPASAPVADAAPSAPAADAAPIADGDEAVTAALIERFGRAVVLQLMQTDGFAARVVATVDNLPRGHVAPRLWPINPTAGRFSVDDD